MKARKANSVILSEQQLIKTSTVSLFDPLDDASLTYLIDEPSRQPKVRGGKSTDLYNQIPQQRSMMLHRCP